MVYQRILPSTRIRPKEWFVKRWLADPHCYYCGRRTIDPRKIEPWVDGLRASADHVIPKSRGGGNGDNIVLTCRDCNDLKGDLSLQEFIDAVMFVESQDIPEEKSLNKFYKPLLHWEGLREFWSSRLRAKGTSMADLYGKDLVKFMEAGVAQR